MGPKKRTEREILCGGVDNADKRWLLNGFKVHQLRWWLEDRGANTNGNKDALISRILQLNNAT